MKIKRIVVGELEENCYIVEKNNECIIIDPGDEAIRISENITKPVVGILVTHHHFDHVGALDKMKEKYNITKENKIFIANFYKYGFAGIIENWIITEMKESPESIIKKLNVMISGSFEEAVKKMSN